MWILSVKIVNWKWITWKVVGGVGVWWAEGGSRGQKVALNQTAEFEAKKGEGMMMEGGGGLDSKLTVIIDTERYCMCMIMIHMRQL